MAQVKSLIVSILMKYPKMQKYLKMSLYSDLFSHWKPKSPLHHKNKQHKDVLLNTGEAAEIRGDSYFKRRGQSGINTKAVANVAGQE